MVISWTWFRALFLLVAFGKLGKGSNENDRCRESNQESLCLTSACVHSAANILKNLNESVDPCEDFYSFACGSFVSKTSIPEGHATVSPFTITQERVLMQLKTVLEEPISEKDLNAYKLLKRYYASCMDTVTIDKTMITVIINLLKSFGGWPVLEDNWEEESFDWTNAMYQFRKVGVPTQSIVNIFPGINTYNSSKNIINCDEARLSLDRRHLVNGFEGAFVQSYYQYIVDLSLMLGANRSVAVKELEESVKFEIALAKITLAAEDRRNMTALTNIMTLAEAQDKFPVIPWKEYLQNLIGDPEITINDNEEIDVGVPKFLAALGKLIESTSKRTIANYIMSQFLIEIAPFSSTKIRTRRSKFMKNFKGTSQMYPRWKECAEHVTKQLPKASGSLYVRKHFSNVGRKTAEDLVDYLRAQFLQMLQTAKWMDDVTRKRAIGKALKMTTMVGYPPEYLDDDKIEEYHRNLKSDTDNFLTLTLNIWKSLTDQLYKGLRLVVNKTDWTQGSSVVVVNAYYNPTGNGIELPAGILQGVFFDHNRPNYLNFGSIGFAIGHEITHGFDDLGRQYDETGTLSDWWDARTALQFFKDAQCIIDQFNNYTSPITNQRINGVNTQGETIADIGGIRNAYLAYKNWVKDHGVEPKLPGLKYTPEQLFWISTANTWCINERMDYLIEEILTDSHPPSDIRVSGIVSNSEYFSKDFNCKAGARMNPVNKCRIW